MIWPEPTSLTEPFWAAAVHGTLLLPRCRHCRAWLHPQDETCPLGHADRDWTAAAGTGTIIAAATVHHTTHPALPAPYTVLVVRLDEGPQLVASLSDQDQDQDQDQDGQARTGRVGTGRRVQVVFDQLTRSGAPGSVLPRFALLDHHDPL